MLNQNQNYIHEKKEEFLSNAMQKTRDTSIGMIEIVNASKKVFLEGKFSCF